MSTVRVTFGNADNFNRINIIKVIREVTGCRLHDAAVATDVGYIDVHAQDAAQLVRKLQPVCPTAHLPLNDRAAAEARLRDAWGMLEDRIVVRVANLLAKLLEKA